MAFPFPDHLDTQKASGFHFNREERLRGAALSKVYPSHGEVFPFYNLFLGLQVSKGGGGGGQADEGGEVEVGGNLLQRQDRQGGQAHRQKAISRTLSRATKRGKLGH